MPLTIEMFDSHIIWAHKDFDESYILYNKEKLKFKLINIRGETLDAIEATKWQNVVTYVLENIDYESKAEYHIQFNYMHTWTEEKIIEVNKIIDEWDDDINGISRYILMLV